MPPRVDMVSCRRPGRYQPKWLKAIPSREAMISGFVAIPKSTPQRLGRWPLNISRASTARALNMGITMAISSEAVPAALSPKRDMAMGIPKSTKLLLNIPWSMTPRRELSCSVSNTSTRDTRNSISTPATAKNRRSLLRVAPSPASYMFIKSISGRKTLKMHLFTCRAEISFISPVSRMT